MLDARNAQFAGLADRGDTDVADRELVAAQELRCEVDEIFVDESRGDEGARERRAALDEGATDALPEQPLQDLGEVAAAGLQHASRVIPQAGIAGDVALADDDGQRLVIHQLAAIATRRERGVVSEHGAGTDEDGVARGALLVHALA